MLRITSQLGDLVGLLVLHIAYGALLLMTEDVSVEPLPGETLHDAWDGLPSQLLTPLASDVQKDKRKQQNQQEVYKHLEVTNNQKEGHKLILHLGVWQVVAIIRLRVEEEVAIDKPP